MVRLWISYNVSRNYVVIKGAHVIVYGRIKSFSFKNCIMHELYARCFNDKSNMGK